MSRRIVTIGCIIGSLLAPVRGQETGASPALTRAVEEFRIQTSTLAGVDGESFTLDPAAAAPRPSWHGRLYENFRNNVLDAIPHEIVQRDQPQRKLRRNQFGFNVTGPVWIPKIYDGQGKTFFTLSFEAMRESIGQSQLNTIPTTLERTGSWSHVVDFAGNPLPIYDPLTTFENPAFNPALPVSRDNLQYNRVQFPDNQIPVNRLDPVALAALLYYPEPNANAGPFFRNNYFVVSQETNTATGFIFTVDHSFLSKHRVTVRANNSNGVNGRAPIFPTVANPNQPPNDARSRGIRLEHIFTASATNINTLRLQVDSTQTIAQTQFDPDGKVFPRYQIAGYQNMGTGNALSSDAQHTYQFSDTFATRWQRHRVSIQDEYTHYQINTFRPQFPEGRFDFTAGLTSLPGIINTGHGFASFLLGQAAEARKNVVIAPSYFRWSQNRVVFSDQWQVTPSLTATIGANFEIYTQRIEKYDRQSNISLDEINPANGRYGALVVAGQNGYGRAFPPTWMKVEPSLGIAWSVLGDNDTVLRASLDRRYGEPQRPSFQFGTQAFNGNPVYLSANQQLVPAAVLAQGLPELQTFPDTSPESANGTVANYVDTSNRQPTAMNFEVGVQRQLAPFLILTTTYRHEYRRNQFINRQAANPNAIPISALQFDAQLNDLNFANSLRPYPQYQDFEVAQFYPGGRQITDQFTMQLEKRTSGGLAMTVNYTYRMQMDNSSQNVQNVYDLNQEWSENSNNRVHRLEFSYIYELPFGPGKSFLANGGILGGVFGGWAVSGVGQVYGGQPLSLNAQFNNTGGVVTENNLRASVVPGVDPQVANRGPQLWFNPAAFIQPANFVLGNTPRTFSELRGPGGWNTDLTMNKRFPIGGDRTLEFMASMFNALNHANWNDPDTSIGPATAPNANAGRIIGSQGGRIVQLGLRLNF